MGRYNSSLLHEQNDNGISKCSFQLIENLVWDFKALHLNIRKLEHFGLIKKKENTLENPASLWYRPKGKVHITRFVLQNTMKILM